MNHEERYLSITRTVAQWRAIVADLRFAAQVRRTPEQREAARAQANALDEKLPPPPLSEHRS